MHEGVTAVYRSNVDLFFYVLGSQSENEVRNGARRHWEEAVSCDEVISSLTGSAYH